MSKEEFDYNKDLLKEIVEKKKDLRTSIMMTQEIQNERSSFKPMPAYEIYNLWNTYLFAITSSGY